MKSIQQHVAILIFITIYLTAAPLLTHKDFGATWDEPLNYNKGVASYQHIFNKQVARPQVFNKTNGWLDIQDDKLNTSGLC